MIQLLLSVIVSVVLVTALTTGTGQAVQEKSSRAITIMQQDSLLLPASVNSSLCIPPDSLALAAY